MWSVRILERRVGMSVRLCVGEWECEGVRLWARVWKKGWECELC